jgi:hypothetical protein
VEADLATARAGRLYRTSEGCIPENIASKATRDACEAFRKLEGELETGKAAKRLDEIAATIRIRLASGMAVQTVDPGATAVSLIIGTSADNVAAWSALSGSVALELAGMIAMMRADGRPVSSLPRDEPAKAPEQQSPCEKNEESVPNAHGARKRPTVTDGINLIDLPKLLAGADTVGRFMLACLKSVPGEEAPGGAIYDRYQRWCSEQRPTLPALDPRSFAQQFAHRCERTGIHTRREGRRIYCLDVKLVA